MQQEIKWKVSLAIKSTIVTSILYLVVLRPMVINPYLLSNNFAFTEAKIISKEGAVNGGPDYNFTYTANGKEYKGFFSEDTRYNTKVGDCYWIKYYPPNPKNAKIYLDHPCSGSYPQ